MEAVAQRPKPLTRTQNVALAILAAVAIWSFSPLTPLTIALLAVSVLFLIGLKRPVWAMAAFLISQLTATSYMVDVPFITISLRLLLLLLIGLILWRSTTDEKIDLGPMARRVIIPAVALLVISVMANLANTGFDYVFRDFRNMIVGLLIVIFMPAVIRNTKDLKILCGVAFIGVTASALVGLFQHYQFFGLGETTLIPDFFEQRSAEGGLRVPGMAETELELSFALSVVLPVVLGVYLAKGIKKDTRWLLLVSAVVIGLAVYFTFTRSALLAMFLGLAALPLFFKTRIRPEFILIIVLFGVGIIAATGMMDSQFLGGRSEEVQEESSVSRQILWQSGTAIAIDYPILGVGGDRFAEVSTGYASEVDTELLAWETERYWGYSSLGTQPPHNDFLMLWICYGTLALAFYIWLYVAVLRVLANCYQVAKTRFIRGLSIGLAAAFIAYAANAFYHNLFVTIPLFWILAGLALATAKLALKSPGQKRREVSHG